MAYGPVDAGGGEGPWGMTHAWPVEEAIGSSEEEWEELVNADGDIGVGMSTMLLDRRSGKVAMWFRSSFAAQPAWIMTLGQISASLLT